MNNNENYFYFGYNQHNLTNFLQKLKKKNKFLILIKSLFKKPNFFLNQ